MAEKTAISWTDASFNPWIGCTHAGPGCDFCYAERDNTRRKWVEAWGPGIPRKRTSVSNWKKVRQWNAKPENLIGTRWPGRKPRVFCASLADVFDNEVPQSWRDDLWALIRECPNLQFLIVTKRIINARKMLPADWGDGYPNVVLIATVVNQDEADRDIPRLLMTPARWRGVSIEPMLGPIDLTNVAPPDANTHGTDVLTPFNKILRPQLDWVIAGGESGPHARIPRPEWFRSLRDQCAAAGIPFHFKQWGEYHWDGQAWADGSYGMAANNNPRPFKCGTVRAGRLLDGVEHNGFVSQEAA